MLEVTTSYTIEKFQEINFYSKPCILEENVINKIKKLEEEIKKYIESTTDVAEKTKTYEVNKYDKKNRLGKYDKRSYNSLDDIGNWNSTKMLKITPKIVKEGTEKYMDEIRISLNKLSNKNIDFLKDQIINTIEKILENTQDKEEDIKKISKIIFDTAISNKFFSELYADIYNILNKKFDIIFKNQIISIIENYKESINDIIYVDSNKDYDAYCAYIKKNDIRKASTTFIVHLLKKQILPTNDVMGVILYLEDLVCSYAEQDGRNNEIEEIVENLFILITQCHSELKDIQLWTEEIIENIFKLSKLRKTDVAKYKSMTNRATFKLMDIIDSIKK